MEDGELLFFIIPLVAIGSLVGAKSDIGPVRSTNEDAHWVSRPETPTEFGAPDTADINSARS